MTTPHLITEVKCARHDLSLNEIDTEEQIARRRTRACNTYL